MISKSERAQEIFDIAFHRKLSLEELAELTTFLNHPPRIVVEVPDLLLESNNWKTVHGFLLRKDPPHFAQDEYHVHAEIDGGYEASWNVSGRRRHPGKFPANVPSGLKAAAAKVLKINPELLEMFWIDDEEGRALLIEIQEEIAHGVD